MTTAYMTISDRLWSGAGQARLLRNLVLAVLGSLIVAGAAQINVPMIPIPMTLQTLAVLAIGGAYGSRLGAATLALYALEGAIGLPVFAEMNSLFKPDGTMIASIGYIVGFIPAAYLVGWFAERGYDRSIVKMLIATVLGGAILYIPGLIWLGHLFGAENAIAYGLVPFWIGDLVKAALVALGLPAAWSLLGTKA